MEKETKDLRIEDVDSSLKSPEWRGAISTCSVNSAAISSNCLVHLLQQPVLAIKSSGFVESLSRLSISSLSMVISTPSANLLHLAVDDHLPKSFTPSTAPPRQLETRWWGRGSPG